MSNKLSDIIQEVKEILKNKYSLPNIITKKILTERIDDIVRYEQNPLNIIQSTQYKPKPVKSRFDLFSKKDMIKPEYILQFGELEQLYKKYFTYRGEYLKFHATVASEIEYMVREYRHLLFEKSKLYRKYNEEDLQNLEKSLPYRLKLIKQYIKSNDYKSRYNAKIKDIDRILGTAKTIPYKEMVKALYDKLEEYYENKDIFNSADFQFINDKLSKISRNTYDMNTDEDEEKIKKDLAYVYKVFNDITKNGTEPKKKEPSKPKKKKKN